MRLFNLLRRAVPVGLKSRLKRRFGSAARLQRALAPSLPEVVCVDVGASYYPHPAWELFRESPNTRWVAVDPNEVNLAYLLQWHWPSRVVGCATGLSRLGGRQTLYVTNVDSGSSLLEPVINECMAHRITNRDYFFPLRAVEIDTLTLAQVIEGQSATAPVFVKLDTQGTELDILRGASAQLQARRIVGIEMESTLHAVPVMQGAGKFWEACRDLEGYGFELLHVRPITGVSRHGAGRTDGRSFLNECDAIFALRRDVARTLPVDHRSALFAFYIANRFFEEALSMIGEDRELESTLRHRGANTSALTVQLQRRA